MGRKKKEIGETAVEETQRLIMRVATQLFMELGYRAVSTRRIAEACGLTQPLLYHYFSSKEELYIEIVVDKLSRTKGQLILVAESAHPNRLSQALKYLMLYSRNDMNPMLREVNYELGAPGRQRITAAFLECLIQPLALILKGYLDKNPAAENRETAPVPARTRDPIQASFLLLNTIQQSGTNQSLSDGEIPTSDIEKLAEEKAEEVTHIFLYGWLPRTTN